MPPGNPACTPSTAHGRTHAQECRREETNAIRSLLNTAKVMEDNPTALRLKELETLEKVTDKVGNISVFGGLDGDLEQMVYIKR